MAEQITTADVREAFVAIWTLETEMIPGLSEAAANAAFDAWLAETLAAHDRQVAERAGAQALKDAADAWQTGGWAEDMPPGNVRTSLIVGMAQRAANWLRARADSLAPHPAAPDDDEPECTCTSYVVDYSDPERYHAENVDREDDPACPVHHRADSLAPSPATPALPCHQGVRGCTEVGEHYHPDEKYAKDATPALSVSAEQVERIQFEHFGEDDEYMGSCVLVQDLAALGVTVTDGGA